MNEEALKDAFALFQQAGYNKSIEDFSTLVRTNKDALSDAHKLFTNAGYKKSIDDFAKLIGVTGEVEKKNLVDGTSPMEPMDSTLPQAEADTLSESEELTGYETLSLFKEDEESEASKKFNIGVETVKETIGRIPLFIAEQAVTAFADDEELAYLNSLPVDQREKIISNSFSGLGRITGTGFVLTNEATEFSNEARKRREEIESTLKQYETSIGEDFANLDVRQATTRVFNEVVGTIPQLVQAMIPYVGLASLGLGSAAQKSGELQREGEDLGLRTSANAIVSGTAEAAFELVTRRLGNKLLKAFKVNPDEAIQSFGNSLKETFIDANLEGGSELATTITQNLSDALIQGRDVDVNNVIREAIDAYIIGSAMGGTLTGSGNAVRTTKQVAEKNRLANQIKDTKYNTIEEVFEPSPKFPEGDLGIPQTEVDKETLDVVSNSASRKFLAEGLRRQVRRGDITQEDADARLRDFDRIKKSNERVNQDAPEDLRPQIVEKLREQELLSEEIEVLNQLEKTTGRPEKENIQEKKDRIEEINQEINAIQEQETGDIPDAERAEGVPEVEEEVREPSVEETEEVIVYRGTALGNRSDKDGVTYVTPNRDYAAFYESGTEKPQNIALEELEKLKEPIRGEAAPINIETETASLLSLNDLGYNFTTLNEARARLDEIRQKQNPTVDEMTEATDISSEIPESYDTQEQLDAKYEAELEEYNRRKAELEAQAGDYLSPRTLTGNSISLGIDFSSDSPIQIFEKLKALGIAKEFKGGNFLDRYHSDLVAYAKENNIDYYKGIVGGVQGSLNEKPQEIIVINNELLSKDKVVKEPAVEESEEEVVVEPKTIEQLEEENKSTFPKIPTGKVFLNEPSQPSPEARKRADDVIEAETEADLESETISVKDIIPTQKNLTESNLRETADVSTTEEPIIVTEQEGKFYVIDGHHRLANTILSGNQNAEVKVVKEPVAEETEAQKIELESIKEGSTITKSPIKIFKGIGGKKDLSGQRISAHEGVKGVFSSIDQTLAEEYSRGEGIAEVTIPSSTTVEVVEVELKGSPREFREKEVEAINNSDAQIVKLITIDGRLRPGERRQSQYIIKDTNLIESLQEVVVDQALTEEALPGYGRMMNRIDDIIQRMSNKPDMTNAKILDSVTKNLQSRDPAYRRATDFQREQIIRDLRSRLGVKEKAAPSAKRVTGQPKRKKVTVDEYSSLKSQIRLEAKAAREAVTSYKNAGKKIAEAVKALGGKGKITLRQANTVAKKILRTNFTNTKQVDALLDYVQKIYERAELAEMVSNARGRIKQAKKNLASKVGTNTALKSVVQDVLSLDPTDVPLNLLPQYVALVQSFGERKAVLNLPEQGVVMQTANAILDSIQGSFDVTTTETVEDANYDLDQSVKEITEDKIDTKNILNPDVKKLAEKLNSLTKKDIEGLVTENKDGVKNYAKVENLKAVKREMSKGYAPKVANDLMLEIESQRSLDSLESEGAIANVQNRGVMLIGRTIASIKSLITGKGITQEQLSAIPFIGTSLDNVLGNLNQTQFREKIIDPVANSFSMMTDKLQDIRNEYLQTAEYLLSNDGFVKRSRNSILKSKYKIQLYLLEKENLSNLGSNQVAPAIEFLNETIKYLSKDTSARRNMNKEILEELREEFAPNDGPLDFEKLENSLSKNEMQAATLINQAYNETSSMYEFVSSVVRGEGLKPLNNYVHHSVLKDLDEQKKDNDLTVERLTKPSTKSKTIIERTPGAKAINFDPISSADRGIKMMLTDYYMTNPIREVRSLINKLKSTPDLNQFQKNAFEDLDKVFEESIQIVFGKSLESITGVNNFFNAVEELGYYAALASVPRAAAELGSNFAGAVIMNPRTFSLGVTNFGKLSLDSTSVAKFAAAIGSKSRSKLAPKGIGGKIQQELTNYNVTSRNKGALNPILDKANFIAKNTTGRIGDATANIAQKLLSTPDMAISRPMYFQTFVNEFQKITGEKLTSDDLQAIADGDTKILEQYPDAVSKARDVADTAVERLSGTTNPFKQPLKYQLNVGDDIFAKAYKKANKYMASFYSVENNTATEGVVALFYSGEITRRQATALLAMITTRMSVYMSLYAMLQSLFDELISNALGLRQEEEEDEDYGLLTARQAVGSISTLILRRNLGSVSSIPIMYGIEKVNEEYLDALRGGDEYDKFKNGMVYVPIREGKSPVEQGVSMLSGAKGPAINTISRLATVVAGVFGSDKQETRDQYKEELLNRMSIEVLGNVGLLPFYKDIRRMVIEDTFSEREYQKAIRKLQKQIEKEEERYYREQKKKREKFGK